jgi:hypothetical protein
MSRASKVLLMQVVIATAASAWSKRLMLVVHLGRSIQILLLALSMLGDTAARCHVLLVSASSRSLELTVIGLRVTVVIN